ncbi:amino acid/polyamine/organocation transporter (APC superfamily) [Murinocardiopsis flavida]|uniref:Amino acid/polyamine/organocation transporter (APC superfamily) n=1 Tax=Murinocardiopsis flavida TaxID=645275 RepID=A0A2P8CZR7_9ACTN|nr:amino acid permease [Murinocardiopsis flavida]PSK90478.1 amino acid/polyamine/organocation transporter (APC superfamily) [Murinocardiopsis flavida]
MTRPDANPAPDADAARLAALGYTSEFRRDMSLWANFSLGFTYLSPVVGIYTLFAVSLALGGPPMFWSLAVVGAGQFLVALVFGEIVSQYPLAGGVYPWARRLWGRRWAWMTGWVYLVALLVTIASVSYGAGPFLARLLGFEAGPASTTGCALAVIAVALALNLAGTKWLAWAAIIGFSAELLGALVVGGWLLIAERHHGLGVLFDAFGAGSGSGYLGAFLAAGLIGIFQYYGFEACGDVAEEVPDPTRRIPKAMRMTIYIGGAAAMFVCLALLLAVEDYGAVIGGADTDPVTTVLTEAFGPVGMKVVLGIVLISFVSCALSLQAAASRLLYSYARDGMIAGSRLLRTFLPHRHVPPYTLAVAAAVPALVVLCSLLSTDALTKIISFATLGIYLGFQMVVLAALRARLKGWRPSGAFTLGRWGLPVTIGALVYGVLAIATMAWPRTPEAPWYDDYIVALSGAVVIGLGVLYLVTARPYERGDAPAGDAVPGGPAAAGTAPSSEPSTRRRP